MTEGTTRLLLVEDDVRIRTRIAAALGNAGYAVEQVGSVTDARIALCRTFDLVLLDLGLPDQDGLDLCRELRRAGDRTPIIVVTARDATHQRVRGLDVGADDYVVKPFQLDELFARIRSVLRRSVQHESAGRVAAGDLWADPRTRTAGRGPEEVSLKPREFDLLLFLLRHPDRVWTRDQLLDRVWNAAVGAGTRTVDLHVRRLRAKLERDPGDPRCLRTVYGVGYLLSSSTEDEQP